MHIEGKTICLRAVEPEDIELMYRWENDPTVWPVSGTLVPFSRHTLRRFLDEQQFDLTQTGQQRLIIENEEGRAVGALDLFGYDPLHARAGIGILIADEEDRRRGYAREAIEALCRYGRCLRRREPYRLIKESGRGDQIFVDKYVGRRTAFKSDKNCRLDF